MAIKASDKLIQAIRQYQSGDETAFDTIYYESLPYITKCVLNVVNKTAADASEDIKQDIIQETYLTVATKLHTLNSPEAFLQWAGQTATHIAERTWSKDARRYQLEMPEEELLYEPIDEAFIPEDILQNKEKQRIIRQILEELPTAQYLCVIEYFYNGLKESQVAQKLDLPLNTVKTNLRRAKQKLKDAIVTREKKDGIRLHSMAWLLWIYFLHGMRNLVIDPKTQADTLEAIHMGLGAAGMAGAGAAAGSAGASGAAAGGTAAGGAAGGSAAAAGTAAGAGAGATAAAAGLFAGAGAKIGAAVLAAAVTIGAVAGGIGLANRDTTPEEDRPAAMEYPAAVDTEALDAFYSFFTLDNEGAMHTLDLSVTPEGYVCRQPFIDAYLPNAERMQQQINNLIAPTYREFELHKLNDFRDASYQARMVNGLLYLEDVSDLMPNVALNVLTGEIYTTREIYQLHSLTDYLDGRTFEEYVADYYRGEMEIYSEEGLELTLAEENLLRSRFYLSDSGDGTDGTFITIPLLNEHGTTVGYLDDHFPFPDQQLVTNYQDGLLTDGKTAYRIPQLNFDSDDARALNELFREYADTAAFEGCYSLNYKTWLSGRFLVLQFWSEVFGSYTVNTYYLDLLTGEQVGQDGLLDYLGMTSAQLAETIRPAVKAEYEQMMARYDLPQSLMDQTLSQENLENATIVLQEDGNVAVQYTYYHVADTGRGYGTVPLGGGGTYEVGFLPEFLESGTYPGLEELLQRIFDAHRLTIGRLDAAAWFCQDHFLVGLGWYDTEGQWLRGEAICLNYETGELVDPDSLFTGFGLTNEDFVHALHCYLVYCIGPGYEVTVQATLPPVPETEAAELPSEAPTQAETEAATEAPTQAPAEEPTEGASDDSDFVGMYDPVIAESDAVWFAENHWGLEHGKYYGSGNDRSDGISIVCDGFFTDANYIQYYTFRLTFVNPDTGVVNTAGVVHINAFDGSIYNP